MNLLKIITPINIEEEKIKFFTSSRYNPVFKYLELSTKIVENENKLSQKQKLINAIISQDSVEISKCAMELYSVDLEKFVTEANQIIDKGFAKLLTTDLTLLEHEFEESIKFFEIDYQLKFTDKTGFNFRPVNKSKTLLVSKHAKFDFFSARSELQHEFVHIIRYINHKKNNIPFDSSYLPTEEGLASLMQDATIGENYSGFQHAAEYLASAVGIKGSLRDIYDFFVEIGFSQELAWQRAIRHKFGFVDTSVKGDIIKPAMYYYNSKLLEKESKENILKLFKGRVSLANIGRLDNTIDYITDEKVLSYFDYFH